MVERVDAQGAAHAGSQLQTQLYVNKRTRRLIDELRAEFPELGEARIEWRSPLADDGYAEYYGRAFLERVDLSHHAAELATFWPSRGPQWDALAVVRHDGSDQPGVLLVEGKSHVGEMLSGSSCAAVPGSASRTLIEASLGWTQQRLGVQGKARRLVRPALSERQPAGHACLAAVARRARVVRALPVRRGRDHGAGER